jgi:tetratricopeptide (TPR) repeat protein
MLLDAGQFSLARSLQTGANPQQIMDAETFKLHQTRHFYAIAAHCEQNGDWEMARNCYEEAMRISPESTFGMLAAGRLHRLQGAELKEEVVQARFVGFQQPPQKPQEVPGEERMEPRRMLESWRMLQVGESYRLAGDLDNAFRCFQDAHAICPASRYGQAAMGRMIEVERVRSEQQMEQQRRRRAPDCQDQDSTDRRPYFSEHELLQRERASALFFLAESYSRGGDARLAYTFFQESHLASPTSYHGMRAIERIHELETRPTPPHAIRR